MTHLTHGLSSTNLLVYLRGKGGLNDHVNQYGIGATNGIGEGSIGAFWSLQDENTIRIVRAMSDLSFKQFRVQIWKLPTRTRG
jgi:hypothetical protein